MKTLVPARDPDWVHLSREWERSGLPQKEFCELAGVSYTAFCHHRGQVRKRERQAARLFPIAARDERCSEFIPVTVESEESQEPASRASASPLPEIEIELPFGVVLRFRGMVQS